MRVSEQWLRSWVNPSENTDEIVSLVTFAAGSRQCRFTLQSIR